MTIEEAIIYGKKFLSSIDAKMLLSSVVHLDTLELINKLNYVLTYEEENLYKDLINARKNNIPIQYILNSVNFYGLDLYVDKNVLIPRFETEELVENTIKLINENLENKNINVLDLCCGSGAIGLALKSHINDINLTMSDISKDALLVAGKNSKDLNIESTIIESDLFQNINSKFDCIISNPPYIRNDEEIEDIVKNNEPSIALYGGDDGLLFYDRILSEIKNYLNDRFIIAFEIGATQKDDIISIVNKYLNNVDIVCKKDLSGRDRMLFITKLNV